MNFTIITHVLHKKEETHLYGYGPYVWEMNIWFKYVDKVSIVAPLLKDKVGNIDLAYQHPELNFQEVPALALTTPVGILRSLLFLPLVSWRIYKAMQTADHIHLRCPGNMGLLGCLVQILFPNKAKTAKYAGNWDPKSKQPLAYRIQKYILSNTFLTKNMQVLVYGDWENQSKNIKPFFTATYSVSEKESIEKPSLDPVIELIFVGSLVKGKNPMYAIRLAEKLIKKGKNVVLNIYGEGVEKEILRDYIKVNQLENHVLLHGNQNQDIIKKAYKKSHFVVLPSKSEGWPKAIAEGMFWGCVPVATKVSCVPFILDYGNRGIFLDMDLEKDVIQLEEILENEKAFFSKSKLALEWSQNYTTTVFETEIKKILTE